MTKKILITSALPYANGPLHFGHIAGAYLPGDVYARFQRLCGKDVLYICGSDEHGVAITLSASIAKRTPKEHVDLFHKVNQKLFEKLEFSFDHYSRTTWKGHIPTTQEFFRTLKKKGYIEERIEDHLYSEEEKRFLADRYVIGTCPKCGFQEARGDECQNCASSYEATDLKNPRSKLTGAKLTLKPSNHLYLRFDLFKEKLSEWIQGKLWKSNVIHFAMQYINDLKDRAITRDSDWGIPVPGYEGKVFYVWFDAPIGYISATKELAEIRKEPKMWEDYWFDPDCKLVHFIGKDNIPFHAVFFPAILMGQDRPYILPAEIPANEFFHLEGRQFSKSDGWTIDLEDFFQNYSADQARYAIAANAPETSDSEFSWKDFQMRCNAELLGKLGNFVNRVLVFVVNHFGGKVPFVDEKDELFEAQMKEFVEIAKLNFEHFHLRKACQTLMEFASLGNTYFDHHKPWVLVKQPSKQEELNRTLYMCLECAKNLALISSSIIPLSAQRIWQMLGFKTILAKENWEKVHETALVGGQKLGDLQVLFKKVENEQIEKQIEKLGQTIRSQEEIKASLFAPQKSLIDFDHFEKIDLRIGKVIQAETVPKSKKLLKLLIDLNFEKRTIISGIATSYKPGELIGKKVIIVANLKPVKIMGIESQGMILAASFEKDLELPQIQSLVAGSVVS